MNFLPENFKGQYWNLVNNWFDILNLANYQEKPIKYLEIGTLHGANLITVSETYGKHPDSKLYCIDPWEDYIDYPEYKNIQESNYSMFLSNLNLCYNKHKITINRGYSHIELLKFPDLFFDIIYIDGNHEPEYVLEDAVVSFRKLKHGGVMIFDDYCNLSPDLSMRGINAFLSGYYKKITNKRQNGVQLFIEKI
jgi:SAM-dependent methyltransferase